VNLPFWPLLGQKLSILGILNTIVAKYRQFFEIAARFYVIIVLSTISQYTKDIHLSLPPWFNLFLKSSTVFVTANTCQYSGIGLIKLSTLFPRDLLGDERPLGIQQINCFCYTIKKIGVNLNKVPTETLMKPLPH
jgi:hypothetical protein